MYQIKNFINASESQINKWLSENKNITNVNIKNEFDSMGDCYTTISYELLNKPVETTNEQPKIDILKYIKDFTKNPYKDKEGENDLTLQQDMLLCFSNFLLSEIGIFKDREHFCEGGTCTHGKCPDIGKIVKCDRGCMYLGA